LSLSELTAGYGKEIKDRVRQAGHLMHLGSMSFHGKDCVRRNYGTGGVGVGGPYRL